MSLQLQSSLEEKVLAECAKGHIELPSLPDIALRIRDAVNNPDKGINEIARLVEMDPNIAARVIKIANSSMFSGYSPASTCMDAVARLGLHVIQNIVICVAVNNLFSAPNAQLRSQLESILNRSRRIAAIAYVLGSIVKGMRPEKAMLAGLTCQIGALPIINYLGYMPELKNNPGIVDSVVSKLSSTVGTMVLQQWNFDEQLISVPENFENWFYNESKMADYTDLVIVANIHSRYGQSNQHEHLPSLVDLPAFKKLGLSQFGPEASMGILLEAQEDIRQASRMLAV